MVISLPLLSDEDDAMRAFAGESESKVIHLEDATNTRLLKKIDWHLMPVCSRFANVPVLWLS